MPLCGLPKEKEEEDNERAADSFLFPLLATVILRRCSSSRATVSVDIARGLNRFICRTAHANKRDTRESFPVQAVVWIAPMSA